jgi:hypothetical protein
VHVVPGSSADSSQQCAIHPDDERAVERAIGEVALEAYRYFEMRGKTSEYGRVLSAPATAK